ncbi:MAG TPA: TetR/AcrR family transcriptional regulator [Bryobacteraceae bacterium]|nr:TetR/AcrR family transcriptional regulator [Bryobacteraceae bacterium]
MLSPGSTQPRRIPCQERGERRVAELLEAAESVIAEAGYEAATMSAIAERAAAPIGSLYQFFPCKAAITQALRAAYSKQFEATCAPLIEEARTLSLRRFVSRLIDLTTAFVDSHPAFPALLDAPRSTRSSPAVRRPLLERFAGLFLIRQPRMSKVKARQLAVVTMQIIKALNLLYTELPREERDAFVREYKIVLYSYLNARVESRAGARGERV